MKSVFTAGRAPWYDIQTPSQRKPPFIIGVAGGTASGKSSVCKAILQRLDVQWVAILPTDSFYRQLSPAEHERADQGLVNFDHPAAFDWELLRATLRRLKNCERVEVPHYNFKTHAREPGQGTTLYGADVVIVEGIMALYDRDVRGDLDMRVFVDTDSDVRLCRRLRRDIAERGRDVDSVLTQYERYVKPAYDEFVLPTKQYADIVVPRGAENHVAIDLIATHVANKLAERAREQLDETPLGNRRQLHLVGRTPRSNLPDGVSTLPDKATTKAVVTQLRDRATKRADFVHFADRLTHQLLEMALALLPMQKKSVTTRTGAAFDGYEQVGELTAVSVMRAGDAIVNNLRKIVRRCHYGQILIQSDSEKRPSLFYVKLPKTMDGPIMLCDPLVGTGQTMTMAIRVMLDHGADISNIIVVALFVSAAAAKALMGAFPKLRICAAVVEAELDANGYLVPGVGEFTNRYYGTEETEQDRS